MVVVFPSNPAIGQSFTGTNAVTYIWTGDRWSAALAIYNGQAVYIIEGGDAYTEYDPLLNDEIDVGGA